MGGAEKSKNKKSKNKSGVVGELDLASSEPTDFQITWLKEPAKHDYAAAVNYLSLLFKPVVAARIVDEMSGVPDASYHAKDILRAACLPLLSDDDPSVARELAKISAGIELSPILLVRGVFDTGVPMQIADGYHRTCAAYHIGDDELIPVRIVEA